MNTDSFAASRIALFAKRDAILKENRTLCESLAAQSDSLVALCDDLTSLLLTRESQLAERDDKIAAQQETIYAQQTNIKRCQTELNTLRREIAALRRTTDRPNEDETATKRGKSLQRAIQKQRKDHLTHQHTLEVQVADLTARLCAKDEEISSLRHKWEEAQLRYVKLMELYQTQQEELLRLRPVVPKPAETIEERSAPDPICTDSLISELNQHARTLTISVVGGSPTWQKKAQDAFPMLRFLGNQDFDDAKLATTDILLINTNHVSHSCTTKAANLAAARHTEICYTSKHNLTQIAELLCERIHSILS